MLKRRPAVAILTGLLAFLLGPIPHAAFWQYCLEWWPSRIWAGYVTTVPHTTYTRVAGAWTVPYVSRVRPPHSLHRSRVVEWIGIGGWTGTGLIQVGTTQVVSKHHHSLRSNVFWEILPAPAVILRHFSVPPGDRLAASIVADQDHWWTITIKDRTTQQMFTTMQRYTGSTQSAEWIVEDPTIIEREGQGGKRHQWFATLARFSPPVPFQHLRVNGRTPELTGDERIEMVSGQQLLALPSLPSRTRNGFSVAYGAVMPAPPPASSSWPTSRIRRALYAEHAIAPKRVPVSMGGPSAWSDYSL